LRRDRGRDEWPATERISIKDYVTPLIYLGDRVDESAPGAFFDGFTSFTAKDVGTGKDNPTSPSMDLTDEQREKTLSAQWTVRASHTLLVP